MPRTTLGREGFGSAPTFPPEQEITEKQRLDHDLRQVHQEEFDVRIGRINAGFDESGNDCDDCVVLPEPCALGCLAGGPGPVAFVTPVSGSSIVFGSLE